MMLEIDRRRLFAGLAAAPFVASAAFAKDGSGDFSREAVAEDVRLLRDAYEALHPGLLRYNDPASLTERFDGLAANGGRDLESFYLGLSRLLASVRCGHSYANFYNQRAPVRGALLDRADRLPLEFVWLNDRMVVTADPEGLGLARGDRVIELNGEPVGAVLAALMTVARADGANDGKRRQLMSVQGRDAYESFDIFYPLLFGSRTRHRMLVEGADGRRRQLVAPAISLERRRDQRPPQIDAGHDTPVWTIRRVRGAAVLTMPGWALYDSKWDWLGWLDREIDALIVDEVPRLVIDIRDNEGGLDCGDALLARFTAAPIRKDDMRRLTRYRRIPDALRPYLDTWDRSFDDWGDDAQPYDERFFTLAQRDDEGAVIMPKAPRYRGEVRVLIGPENSSATFQFARLVQREGLGRLLGETTGAIFAGSMAAPSTSSGCRARESRSICP